MSSEDSGKENVSLNIKKRKISNDNNKKSKKVRVDDDLNTSKDAATKLIINYDAKKYNLHDLHTFTYGLNLSVAFTITKFIHKHKLSIEFDDYEVIDELNDIVFRNDEKLIYVKIDEDIGKSRSKSYKQNAIHFMKLFGKEKCFSILFHFRNFVDYLLSSKLDANNIQFIIFYSNSSLDITNENELIKHGNHLKSFYPFKFDIIKDCDILKDLFSFGVGGAFYKFSEEESTRKVLFERLKFTIPMRKRLQQQTKYSENEIIELFLNKLVFSVNQCSLENLNFFIKKEIEHTSFDYENLRESILCHSLASENCKKYDRVFEMIFSFNLIASFLHSMWLHKNINLINYEISKNGISLCHEDGIIIYVKTDNSSTNENISNLLNKYFEFFIENLKNDVKYFIVYSTNLGVIEDNKFFKFDKIDLTSNETHEILKYCPRTENGNFYQISSEEITRQLISLTLVFPNSLQKEKEHGKLSIKDEKELKENFLQSLIIAINEPGRKNLENAIRKKINESNNNSYNYDNFYEIASHTIESGEKGQVLFTKELFEKDDIIDKFQLENKEEEIKFARTVVGTDRSKWFNQFLIFLIEENIIEILKQNGINPSSVSGMISGSHASCFKNFRQLYDLWFDDKGKPTKYLKVLEKEGIKVSTFSSILAFARSNVSKGFKELYDLWFDEDGNKTKYLTYLEKHDIKLSNMSYILYRSGAEGAKVYKALFDKLIDENGDETHYLKILKQEDVKMNSVAGILNGVGVNAVESFEHLYHLWFDKEGNKTLYLKTFEKEGIKLSSISHIMHGVRVYSAKVFSDLYSLWFEDDGTKGQYLKVLEKEGINLSTICNILGYSGYYVIQAFVELYNLWFDEEGRKKEILKTLEKEGLSLSSVSNMLSGAGRHAARAFKELYDLWFDEEGGKKCYLNILENEGVKLSSISSMLNGAGANAARVFKNLYDLWFDSEGNKRHYLNTLEKEGIKLSNISSTLDRVGVNAVQAFKNLYQLWFNDEDKKSKYLITFEKEGINLKSVSSILHGAGENAPLAFKNLYKTLFDENGKKRRHLKYFVEDDVGGKGFELSNILSILSGAGAGAGATFKELCNLLFDEKGNKKQILQTLEKENINLRNVSSILSGSGVKAGKTFEELYDLWFDKSGNKTRYLMTLEKEEINLSNMFSILSGAGHNAAKAFKGLYELWFNESGHKTKYFITFEKEEIKLNNISSILGGAGSNAAKAFNELYEAFFDDNGDKKPNLKHFIKKEHDEDKCFTIHNISSILSGAGGKVKIAFAKLHDVLFNEEGKRTSLFVNFNNAGFKPSNLSGLLCRAGDRASLILKRLHNVLFDENGESTQIWNDFYEAGFSAGALCSILSGAADDVEKFHHFCFVREESKIYLIHFGKNEKSFRPGDLAKILHGAGSKIYGALKEFHDICFDEFGNISEILKDFEEIGFKREDLSNILSMAGNNATSILRNFHQLCFNQENYLNHFLAEENLWSFKSDDLSKILYGAGVNICPMFEKLHETYFRENGRKTDYFEQLVKNEKSEIINELYKKIREGSFGPLEDDDSKFQN